MGTGLCRLDSGYMRHIHTLKMSHISKASEHIRLGLIDQEVLLSLFFRPFLFNFIYMSVLPAHMYVCAPCACLLPVNIRKDGQISELELRTVASYLLCGCWELNLGLLQEPTEPALQPPDKKL